MGGEAPEDATDEQDAASSIDVESIDTERDTDASPPNAAPDSDVFQPDVAPYCGDGVWDDGEACDDGNLVNDDYCSNDCVPAACGDGMVQNVPPDVDTRWHFDDGVFPAEFVSDGYWSVLREQGESRIGSVLRSSFVALDSPTKFSVPITSSLGVTFSFQTWRSPNVGGALRVYVNSALQVTIEPTENRERYWVDVAPGQSEVRFEYDYGLPIVSGEPVWIDDIRVRSSVMLTEACDDGDDNGTTPNACRSDCELPACGDGVVDDGEVCDDGNTANDDGCSAACDSERCGDGRAQPGEQCDDGNTQNDDGCSAVCEHERCGDGIVQPGEQCDDGNDNNHDACTVGCEPPGCGDGFVQAHEQCDDRNASNTDACLNTCVAARCGDGFVREGREQCDDGNTDDDDGCSASCQDEFCGDGVLQAGEQCDDGNRDNEDACSNVCEPPRCGDGELRTGGYLSIADYTFGGSPREAVDVSAWEIDGWSQVYFWDWDIWFVSDALPPGGSASFSIPVDAPRRTFMRVRFALSSSALTDVLKVYVDGQLSLRVHEQPRFEERVVEVPAGEHVVRFVYEVSDLPRVHPQFALIKSIRFDDVRTVDEECDDGHDNAYLPSACRPDCRLPRCGDGVVDDDEQCDDGNLIADDGCSHICLLPGCGDGVVQAGEACDDGNVVNDDMCTNTCARPVCGDGILAGDEMCDGSPAGYCTDACVLPRCGDGILQPASLRVDEYYTFDDGELPAGSFRIGSDGWVSLRDGALSIEADHDRPAAVRFSFNRGEQVVVAFDREVAVQDEGSVYLRAGSTTYWLDERTDSWSQPHGSLFSDRVEYALPRGATGFEIGAEIGDVEWAWIGSDYSIARIDLDNLSIRSVLGGAEECDDGVANALAADACRPYCQLPRCGDGVVDSGEECDDGNPVDTDGCKSDCSLAVCGDGIADQSEECDDGNTSSTDGCTNACLRATCGDGYVGAWTQHREFYAGLCTISGASGPESCVLDCVCKDLGYEWAEGYERGDSFSPTIYEGEFIENRLCGEGRCAWSDDVPGSLCGGESSIVGVTCARRVLETCDDGNTAGGDGCSSSCQVER